MRGWESGRQKTGTSRGQHCRLPREVPRTVRRRTVPGGARFLPADLDHPAGAAVARRKVIRL